jgi:hypothetical protein
MTDASAAIRPGHSSTPPRNARGRDGEGRCDLGAVPAGLRQRERAHRGGETAQTEDDIITPSAGAGELLPYEAVGPNGIRHTGNVTQC